MRFPITGPCVAAGVFVLGTLTPPAASAADADTSGARGYDATTSVGVHNTYERATYPYLADALDAGGALVELDVWTNAGGPGWRVSHANPFGNDNNCVGADAAEGLREGPGGGDLGACLTDMRTWHDANPGHRPITVKIEMKDGFTGGPTGRGPAEFDALVRDRLGDAVFGPADLVGAAATPDEAVREVGWPARDELAGRFVFELIPGTVEESNPLDTLWTDREYAEHLRALAAVGALGEAAAFPAVHGAAPGDPRLRYADESLRPWFVVFDGDARAFTAGDIDTGWYRDNGYLVIATDAHQVAPPIDARTPDPAAATARVRELADRSASIVTADWATLPGVLSSVVDRAR